MLSEDSLGTSAPCSAHPAPSDLGFLFFLWPQLIGPPQHLIGQLRCENHSLLAADEMNGVPATQRNPQTTRVHSPGWRGISKVKSSLACPSAPGSHSPRPSESHILCVDSRDGGREGWMDGEMEGWVGG